MVEQRARHAADLLDLGTGGGERLAAMAHRPPRTVATESWQPNVEVARSRLGPLGITVVSVEAAPDNVDQSEPENRGRLPFPPASFELVTSRHESFVPSEVARVLRDGGCFLTQQVGEDGSRELHDLLQLPPPQPRPAWTLAFATGRLERAGLTVTASGEARQTTTFADVGALAWFLRAAPWTVPSFSIDRQRPQLLALHARIRETGPVSVPGSAFWVEALKPAPG